LPFTEPFKVLVALALEVLYALLSVDVAVPPLLAATPPTALAAAAPLLLLLLLRLLLLVLVLLSCTALEVSRACSEGGTSWCAKRPGRAPRG
jgi:hypothetical protein